MGDNHGYPNYCRNWMARSHDSLYSEIHGGPGPSAMQGTVDTYSEIGDLFKEVEADIQVGLKKIGVSYEGAGSEAAQSGITVLRQWTNDAQFSSNTASQVVSDQTMAFSFARSSMPKPVEVTAQDSIVDKVVDIFGGTTPREEQEVAAREAHLEAARVMSDYDVTTSSAVNAMPTWVPPPSVTVEVPTPTPTTTCIDSTGPAPPTGTTQRTIPTDTVAPPPVSQTPPILGTTVPARSSISSSSGDGRTILPPQRPGEPVPTPVSSYPQTTTPTLPPSSVRTPSGQSIPPPGTGSTVPPIGTTRPPTGGSTRSPSSTGRVTGPGTRLPGGGSGYGGGTYPPGAGGATGAGGDYERGGNRYGRGSGGFGPLGFADPDGPGSRPAGPRGSLGAMDAEGFGPRGSGAGGGAYGSPGSRGAGGGILGPAAGGGHRENDGEHKRKYQVTSDEYFADDRLVPPPVIGENPHG